MFSLGLKLSKNDLIAVVFAATGGLSYDVTIKRFNFQKPQRLRVRVNFILQVALKSVKQMGV